MEQIVSFQIRITKSEFKALQTLAQREYRDFRQQAGILIRAELEHRGLLTPIESQNLQQQARELNGGANESQ